MKDGTPHPTGFWMEEFVRPHETFVEAGFDVSIATPQGRTPTVDPLSLALAYNHDDQSEVDSLKAYWTRCRPSSTSRSRWRASIRPSSTSCSSSGGTGRCRTWLSTPISAA